MVHGELNKTESPKALPKASPLDFLNWLLGRRKRFRVAGLSMEPTLREGQTVLVDLGAYRSASPEPGDVLLATMPGSRLPSIKRLRSIDKEGLDLRGDNAAMSTDSVTLGPVSPSALLGRVVCTFP